MPLYKCKTECYFKGVRCKVGQRYSFPEGFLPKASLKFFESTSKEKLMKEDKKEEEVQVEKDLGIQEIDEKKVKPRLSPEDEKNLLT